MVTLGSIGHATTAIRIPGIDCAIELRRSPRAQRLALKLSQTERAAVLTMPTRTRVDEAGQFLNRHLDWLRVQIDLLPAATPFTNGAVIPVRGMAHRIAFVGAVRHQGVIWAEADSAVPQPYFGGAQLDLPRLPRLCVTGGDPHAARRLDDWLRAEARADLTRRSFHFAAILGCQPKRVAVRDQATRWGSCSTSGTISYSWRLIFAPDHIRDYVAAHEVAHIREMNHGPRFWRLVRDCIPAMDGARLWLKRYGVTLHSFGRADSTVAAPTA